MKNQVPITEIMSKNPITISPSKTLYEVEELLNRHNIRHIPVIDGDRLVGVISRSDLLKISVADLNDDEDGVESVIFDNYTISQVMTKMPVFIDISYSVKDAAELLSQQSFHSLPVVDEGKLIGIVTSTDLIKYLIKLHSEE